MVTTSVASRFHQRRQGAGTLGMSPTACQPVFAVITVNFTVILA